MCTILPGSKNTVAGASKYRKRKRKEKNKGQIAVKLLVDILVTNTTACRPE
jgi:hypothetical protein